MTSRRSALKLLGGAGLTLSLAGCVTEANDGVNPGLLRSKARLPQPFSIPLPIPVPLAPTATGTFGTRYDMALRQAEAAILPGYSTQVWAYNGIFPGPYLVASSGKPMVLHQRNQLAVPVVTHLHGGLTPPSDDGFPTDLVLPDSLAGAATMQNMPGMQAMPGMSGMSGMTGMNDPQAQITTVDRTYTFPMRQRAATLWYHDHRMGFTGPQVWKGMFGLCVVRDAEEDALPLPHGEREIPLMITDRAFDADGQLVYPATDPSLLSTPGVTTPYMAGVTGDVVLVNGAPWPFVEVAAARYRLRFLNASNARRYDLWLDGPGDGSFVQIGGDGGLLAAPITHRRLSIAPAERFDVIVDFSRYPVGSTVVLRNAAAAGGPGQVMQFRVTHRAPDDSHVPNRLSQIERLEPNGARRRLVFSLVGTQWKINGRGFDPARPLLRPSFGDVEEWEILSVERHPVHIHGAQFQVLGRGSSGPGRYDAGWKDTVELSPGSTLRIAVRFDAYRGRYLVHCHNLEHEDMAMMATIQVA